MVWVQHFLFLLILGAAPLWDHFEIPRLKADPGRKVFFYRQIVLSQWPLSAIVLLVVGRQLWSPPASAAWTWLHDSHTPSLLWGFVGGLLAIMLLPFVGLTREKTRAAIRKALRKLDYILPSRAKEDAWFAALCVTAGVCEEWLYRGFLLHYLATGPWHLSLGVALILSAGIFGFNHLYQGLSGMFASAILGLVFGLMYFATGSLLLPMILHAVVDLRALGLAMGSREQTA
jgi:membrane protease YdiL (CAAX protease family)